MIGTADFSTNQNGNQHTAAVCETQLLFLRTYPLHLMHSHTISVNGRCFRLYLVNTIESCSTLRLFPPPSFSLPVQTYLPVMFTVALRLGSFGTA